MTTTNINRDAQLSTIANAAYLNAPPKTITIGGVAWTYVTDSGSSTSGFYGVAYRNPQTNEIAVAYRGTDGMSDMRANTTFANGGWNPQFTDAAKFTADVKALTTGGDERYQGAKLLATGHSLGDGIGQVMAKMFNLDGTGFEGPGANRVVQNAQFAVVKGQYAPDTTGQIGSYTTYRAAGSAISSVGTHLGRVENLVNLSNGSAIGLAGAVIGIVGVTSGGVGSIFFGALGLGVTNVADKHGMDGIERGMHVAAGLHNAINDGRQSMVQVPLSSATGQAWTGDGAEPQVTAFKNASGQVTAYVQSTGNSWKLSTADQQTSVTLTNSQTPGQPPQCVVTQVGKEPYSCVINEAGGTLTRQIDTGVNGSVDQTTSRTFFSENIYQTNTFNGAPTNGMAPSTSVLTIDSERFDLLDAAQTNDASSSLNDRLSGGDIDQSSYDGINSSITNIISGSNPVAPNPPYEPGKPYYGKSALSPINNLIDNSAPISNKTFIIYEKNGNVVKYEDLGGRFNINRDNKISGSELDPFNAWIDINENGVMDGGQEYVPLKQALSNIGAKKISLDSWARALHINGNTNLNLKGNWGDIGSIRFNGTSRHNVLNGSANNDMLSGGGGNDSLNGNDGRDAIYGDDGNDTLAGGGGDDVVGRFKYEVQQR